MRGCKICHIDPDSPLRGHAAAGDALIAINGNPIHDVLDYKYYAYDTRLAVELESETGERRTVTSEPYVQDLNVFLSGKSVEVHYTPDGEVWAEPAEYRESMEQESIGDDKKRTDRRYWVSEHAVPLALGVYAFAGLVIYLIFRSF